MSYGYHGVVIHVHLDKHTFFHESIPEDLYKLYPGGSALGLFYVLKHTPVGVDALAPENTLILALSGLTGAPIAGQSRMTAVAKSPLSDAIGDSQSGGFFPAEMKFAGIDALVLHQRSETPVYLWIENGKAELRDAAHLMGLATGEVEDLIKEELGDSKVQILQTGPAGELGVRYASMMSMANRANGRTGMGAVMASKNLKAVVVRGKMKPAIKDRAALRKIAKWGVKEFPESNVYGLRVAGTAGVVEFQDFGGGLPTRNWMSGTFEGAEAISGTMMTNTILKECDTCYACHIKCKRVVELRDGAYPIDPRYGGPEYETVAMFGSNCGVKDLNAIAYANQLCNMYGMDTMSCGATIAWAMDCFEHGIISLEDTGGIELNFGNSSAMIEMIHLIGKRKGFGDLLAEGSARASKVLGNGAEELSITVKSVELPAHMPQVKRSLGLIYAVNPFGADHQSSEHDPAYTSESNRMKELGLGNPQPSDVLNEEKVKFAFTTQCFYSAMDTFNVCQFVYGGSWQLYGPNQFVEVINAVLGWDLTIKDVLRVGERRINMQRLFNAREGIGPKDDVLPKKMFKALRDGASDGVNLREEDLESAKRQYYHLAGFDPETGEPSKSKLQSLNIDWAST